MQQKTKRQLQAEQTKDRLFYAALELLTQRDYNDITIRDIVARAEVSIGTFYHYYATKLDVYYDTYRLADRYFAETVAPSLTQPTVSEQLLAFFDHYARYSAELTSPKLTRLLFSPDNTLFDRDPTGGMVGVLTEVLRRGFAEGQLHGADTPEEAALYLMISARGLVYHWCTAQHSYDLPAAMHPFVQRLLQVYLK